MKKKGFVFALLTTLFWGVWGAFIEIPEKAGFPATLGYIIWSLSMIPPALVALYNIKWRLDTRKKPVIAGLLIGFTGAAGQLMLFQALRTGPAYLVFPVISLSPIVTILLSM
ncbi:MAG: EamA family transporter, partial [Sphingobacteriales bacterium]